MTTANMLECIAIGAVSIASAGNFTVDVLVTPSIPGTMVNPTGGICAADPDGSVSESLENNNACSDTVNVFAPPTVTKSFAPNAVPLNGTSTLTITITDPAANPAAAPLPA